MKKTALLILIVFSFWGCQCNGQEERKNRAKRSPKESREARMKARKEFIKKEDSSIQAYIKDRGLEKQMERTGTGLRYQILKDSTETPSIDKSDVVTYEYRIYLLNGSLLYSSKKDGSAELRIDRQEAEIGVHEALKKLDLGDKGRFILPSHLAFGVSGDQNKVPPMTALVYELKVIDIQKSKLPKK